MSDAIFTLPELRALVELAAQNSGRSIEEGILPLFPRVIFTVLTDGGNVSRRLSRRVVMKLGHCHWLHLDLSDAGTVRVLMPLLALVHGFDPGPGGRACMWIKEFSTIHGKKPYYFLAMSEGGVAFYDRTVMYKPVLDLGPSWGFHAPSVAWEPDDDKALVAACKLAVQGVVPPMIRKMPAPYGYCPVCNTPGASRERRLNGNDWCQKGHVYPSSSALGAVPESKDEPSSLHEFLSKHVPSVEWGGTPTRQTGLRRDGTLIVVWTTPEGFNVRRGRGGPAYGPEGAHVAAPAGQVELETLIAAGLPVERNPA